MGETTEMNFRSTRGESRPGFSRRECMGLALGSGLASLSGTLWAADPPFYHDKSNLLAYLDAAGASHPVVSEADWMIRRSHIVANMELVMGPLPEIPKGPLDIEIADELEFENYTRRRITYLARPGDRVPAYLMIPRGRSGRLRAAICPHPTSNRFGKGIPAGVAGAPNPCRSMSDGRRG